MMAGGASYLTNDGRTLTPRRPGEIRSLPTYIGTDGKTFSPRTITKHAVWQTVPPRLAAYKLGERRLVVAHSPHERCGIAEYGRQLDAAMRLMPADPCKLSDLSRGDALLFHYEPALFSELLEGTLAEAKARGVFVVLCCHYLDSATLEISADIHVVHRVYGLATPSMRLIPLGCPVYEPSESRAGIRQRLGLPVDRPIVSTVSFLTQGKSIPAVVDALLKRLDPEIHLQLILPPSFHGPDEAEEDNLHDAIEPHGFHRVTWIKEFIPERELLDRLYASNLGFRYTPTDTGSVSAATKAFVSARCPVVVTKSTHTADIEDGVLRTSSFDVWEMADAIARIIGDMRMLDNYAMGTRREYERLNMKAVAKQYLELFEERR